MEPTKRSLFGRVEQYDALVASLRTSNVVITGPPGVGKTRLAQECFAQRSDALFCDLTSARSAGELVSLVADELGLKPRPGVGVNAEVERIGSALARRDLLVLDNVDHVAGEIDIVDRWSASSSALRILVTSRTPVPLVDSVVIGLEPLALEAAVDLFEARASAAGGTEAEDVDRASVVRELVDRLDRLPLAIELAAARTRVLPPREILARLDRRMETLVDQRRQRTLGGAIGRTWDLLGEGEQQCLAQCTVFRHRFTVADAEAVVRLDDVAVLDAIDRLVVSGWLNSASNPTVGEVTFGLYESIGDFAATHLPPERREQLESAYAVHLCRWAGAQARLVEGRDGVRSFRLLVGRLSALRWAASNRLDAGDRAGTAAVVAMSYPILMHSRVTEYEELVDRAIEFSKGHDLETTVQLLQVRGQMDLLRRNVPSAEEALRRAHALAARSAGLRLQLDATRTVGMVVGQRDPAAAADTLRSAADQARRDLGDDFLEARLRERLGFAHNRCFELTAAYDAFEDAHDLLVRVSNPLFRGESLSGMGYVAWRRADLDEAAHSFGEAVRAHHTSGNRSREAGARFNYAAVLHATGELDEARRQFRAALDTWDAVGLRHFRPAALARLALLECELDDPSAARRLGKRARGEAKEGNDIHNAALAEGPIAFARLLDGREPDAAALEHTIATMNMGADPIAVATHLVLLAGTSGDAGERARFVSRLEELRALAAEADRYVTDVLHALDRLGRGHAALAAESSKRSDSQGTIRAALEIADRPVVGRNPYLRLVAAWLRRRTRDLQGFDLQGRRTLTVHAEAHWFELAGSERVDLTTRRPLRLILRHLVQLRQRDPLAGCSVTDLIEVGWPGEQVSESAGKNRVYTAIRFLRGMGLEDVLITGDAGYQLEPDLVVEEYRVR